MVQRFAVPIIAGIVWGLASVVGMTHGTLLNWPDFVHVVYGFPITFATHTLNTIIGPVDKWYVDIVALTIDLSFWLAGMIAISLYQILPDLFSQSYSST